MRWFRFSERKAIALPGVCYVPKDRFVLISDPMMETHLPNVGGVFAVDEADVPSWRGWEPPEMFAAGRPVTPHPALSMAARHVLLIGRGITGTGAVSRHPGAIAIGINPWHEAPKQRLDAAASIDTGWLVKARDHINGFRGILLGGPKVAREEGRAWQMDPHADCFPNGTLIESSTWTAAWVLAQKPGRLTLAGFDFMGGGRPLAKRKEETQAAFAWFSQCFPDTRIDVDERCSFEVP